MPRILSQRITSNGFEVVTRRGTFALTGVLAAGRLTVTLTLDGQTLQTRQIQNPTLAGVEAAVNDWLVTHLPEVPAVIHLFSANPLSLTIWCGREGASLPTGSWWLE